MDDLQDESKPETQDVQGAASRRILPVWMLGMAIAPVPLTSALALAFRAVGGSLDQVASYGLYGLASAAVIAGLFAGLGPSQRQVVFCFRRPTRWELFAAAVAFFVGLYVYLAVEQVNAALDIPMKGLHYELTDVGTVAIVTLGTVVIAPLAEEVLFRGLVLGQLVERGWSTVASGGATVVLFALIHLPNFGLGGALFIVFWGMLPTVLRLYFGNLTGAWVMHTINNAFTYLLVVGLSL